MQKRRLLLERLAVSVTPGDDRYVDIIVIKCGRQRKMLLGVVGEYFMRYQLPVKIMNDLALTAEGKIREIK